jgi:hypothetical protein
MRTRSSFPEAVEIEVLTKCMRRCALCYALKGDVRAKPNGQIAHIDRNPANCAPGNAAYLCLNHHDEYDGTRRQSKRFKPDELKQYQSQLYEAVQYFATWPGTSTSKGHKPIGKSAKEGVPLEVYDRRIPVYRKTRQFIRDVAENLRPDLKVILQFAWDTDEALFLFDDDLAEYLETLFKKALRLRTLAVMRERIHTHPEEAQNFQAMVQEETGLAMWFTEQPEATRARFAPFLRLESKNSIG